MTQQRRRVHLHMLRRRGCGSPHRTPRTCTLHSAACLRWLVALTCRPTKWLTRNPEIHSAFAEPTLSQFATTKESKSLPHDTHPYTCPPVTTRWHLVVAPASRVEPDGCLEAELSDSCQTFGCEKTVDNHHAVLCCQVVTLDPRPV